MSDRITSELVRENADWIDGSCPAVRTVRTDWLRELANQMDADALRLKALEEERKQILTEFCTLLLVGNENLKRGYVIACLHDIEQIMMAMKEERDQLREAARALIHALEMWGTGKLMKLPSAITLKAIIGVTERNS